MNRVIIILFFLLNGFVSQATVKDSLVVSVDNSKLVQKHFSDDLSQKYSGKAFDYTSKAGQTENLLGQMINWLFQKIESIFGIRLSPEMYDLMKILVYSGLLVFTIYFLIKLLLGTSATSLFTRKGTLVAPLNIQEEHIENVDLDGYIKNALKEENYRLAIRYMYLKSLKLLSLQNKIHWNFEKTNRDYYREIENPELKENFKKVSYLYDNVWYGEYALNKSGFEKAEKDFERLNLNLKNAG